MHTSATIALAMIFTAPQTQPEQPTLPDNPRVTGIKAACRNGQTFVTWKDVADGEAGAAVRYALYRSDQPITQANLDRTELCYKGVMNNSAKLFGSAFTQKDRQNADTPQFQVHEGGKLVARAMPTFVIEDGGQPLPMWTGLAVRTVAKDGKAFYAVVATDTKGDTLSKIEPGESATTDAVEEKVAPIQPIRLLDSKTYGQYANSSSITGKKGLPLHMSMHGSQATGGGGGQVGDYYVYFATAEMGWRDGLPGVFNVYEARGKDNDRLILFTRDCIENPMGDRPIETCWFGYYCVPVGATQKEPRAYAFTERRLEWLTSWTVQKYGADPQRVYMAGQSMGGMVSTQFGFRHPELFAAVYPRLGRVRQTWLPSVPTPGSPLPTAIHQSNWKGGLPMMEDGKTDYWTRMDSVKWASGRHDDLPFYGWCFGKKDTVAAWQDNIDMVNALTANHHGFAFSWNNGAHDSIGGSAMDALVKYYPATKFARNVSYPAFGHSSIDSNMGKGERTDGDEVGGINLGFDWSDIVDEDGKWSIKLSNALAKEGMTVDVTPRRCQKFKAKAGEKFKWTNSAGGAGEAVADQWGLVTVEKVKIKPGEKTELTINR